MSLTPFSGASTDLEVMAPRMAPNPAVFPDLLTIANNMANATTTWEVLHQAGLAMIANARHTAALDSVLNSVVVVAAEDQRPATNLVAQDTPAATMAEAQQAFAAAVAAAQETFAAAVAGTQSQPPASVAKPVQVSATKRAAQSQPAAVSVAARITSGSVAIAGLDKAADETLRDILSTSLGAELKPVITELGTLSNELKEVKGVLHEELSCLCRHTRVLARQLCGMEYDTICSELFGGEEPPASVAPPAQDTSCEPVQEAPRDACAAPSPYELSLRDQLDRMPETVSAMMDTRVAVLFGDLEDRFQERFARLASRDEIQSAQLVELRDEIRAQHHQHIALRDRLQQLPEEITVTIERALTQNHAALERVIDTRLVGVAAARDADAEQTRETLAALRRDQDEMQLRLARLTDAVAAEAQALGAVGSAGVESDQPPGGRFRPGTAKNSPRS